MPLPIFLRDASRLARLCCITAAAALLAGCVTTLPKSDREGPAPVISSQDQQPAPAAAATPDSASPAASDPVAVTETTTAEAAAPALPALPEDLPPRRSQRSVIAARRHAFVGDGQRDRLGRTCRYVGPN